MNRLIILITVAVTAALFSFSPSNDWNGNGEITFKAKSKLYKAEGGFTEWRVTEFELPDDDWTKVRATIEVNTASIYEKSKKLTAHLKSEDFFHVEENNVARFTIDGAELVGADYVATANCIIREIEGTASMTWKIEEGTAYTITGTAVIDRNAHDVGLPKKKWGGDKISPMVEVSFKTTINK